MYLPLGPGYTALSVATCYDKQHAHAIRSTHTGRARHVCRRSELRNPSCSDVGRQCAVLQLRVLWKHR